MTVTDFAEESTFLEIEKNNGEINDYIFFFMTQTSSIIVVTMLYNNLMSDGIKKIEELCHNEFNRVLEVAIKSKKSTCYRFFKKIENRCLPLCFYKNIFPLVCLLAQDVSQSGDIQDLLKTKLGEDDTTFNSIYLTTKTLSTNYLKYYFIALNNNKNIFGCGSKCDTKTIDDLEPEK